MTEKIIFYLNSSVSIQFNPILNAVIWLQLCGKQKAFILKSAFSKEAWTILRFSYSHSRLYLWLSWRLMEVSCKLIIIFYPWTRMRLVLLYHINKLTVTFKLSESIDKWKICHRSILAIYLNYFFYREGPITENFFYWKLRPLVLFVMFQRIFSSWALGPKHFTIFIWRLSILLFSFINKLTFLLSKGLLCLYGKQNNTWLLVDMKFQFSCSTRHLTRSLHLDTSLVRVK